MKKLLLGLMAASFVGLMGCSDEVYADPNYPVAQGCVTFCDDYGCRAVCGPHYYDSDGVLFYWDPIGCWVGPHGYWLHGAFYHGAFYHSHFHGGSHGGGGHHEGGGFHGGGHGGHR